MRRIPPALLLAALLSTPSLAGDKLVVQITPSRVIKVDGNTGAILNSNYIDIDAFLGFGGAFQETRDGVLTANGQIWISNGTQQQVHRFTADGTAYLGSFPTGNCSGMEIASNHLWVAETSGGFGAAVVEYDMTTFAPVASIPLTSPTDVHLYNGVLLASQFSNTIASIDPATASLIGTFGTPGTFQYQMTDLSNGNLLVARWGPPGLYVLSPAGALLTTQSFGFGQPEGVAELGNGHYLVSTQQGIYSWDPVALTSMQIDSHAALFVFDAPVLGPGSDFCAPGFGGVMSCPCANPGMAGNGCDNSAATGGARLTSTGVASLGADTVQLTSTGEKPTSLSIFLQGDAVFVAGVGFGQGVRCVSGQLKRLYVKNAVAGVAVAPTGAELSVHAQALALGDTIGAGNTRYYQTYYRDPVVLGACLPTMTFNVSQAQSITWAP